MSSVLEKFPVERDRQPYVRLNKSFCFLMGTLDLQ